MNNKIKSEESLKTLLSLEFVSIILKIIKFKFIKKVEVEAKIVEFVKIKYLDVYGCRYRPIYAYFYPYI